MENYDLIIIGAGPAGLSCAIYALRASLNILILEKNVPGGNLVNISKLENYPGFKEVEGPSLAYSMYNQVKSLGGKFVFEEAKSIKVENDLKIINDKYCSKNIIVATGTTYKDLELENSRKYLNKGLSYCAICDGSLFKNKDVAVVRAGNSAIQESLYLANICNHVYIVIRKDYMKADNSLIEKINKCENVSVLFNSTISKINGNEFIESIEINHEKIIKVSGIFPYLGQKPSTDFIKHLVSLDDLGFIKVNSKYESNISGIYAIGDVNETSLKQVVVACSQGAIVANLIKK